MAKMTVADLRHVLDSFDDDVEIRVAFQPSYPLDYSIEDNTYFDDEANVLYLAEREQIGYLPGEVSEGLGWR